VPGFSAAATLDLWERAEHLPPVQRAVALAVAAEDGAEERDVARLPLGRRDERLLHLRAILAGDTIDAIATCPACGERVEFRSNVDALVALAPSGPARESDTLELGDVRVIWRPLDSEDVAAAAASATPGDAERVLLERSVVTVTGLNGTIEPDRLPDAVRAAVARAMIEVDPLAEVVIALTCPTCERAFDVDVDIAGFVWAELSARARRILREVAVLARAFGWTEAQVLALPERRRSAYLALVRDGIS
jgi:hypothetical protein